MSPIDLAKQPEDTLIEMKKDLNEVIGDLIDMLGKIKGLIEDVDRVEDEINARG